MKRSPPTLNFNGSLVYKDCVYYRKKPCVYRRYLEKDNGCIIRCPGYCKTLIKPNCFKRWYSKFLNSTFMTSSEVPAPVLVTIATFLIIIVVNNLEQIPISEKMIEKTNVVDLSGPELWQMVILSNNEKTKVIDAWLTCSSVQCIFEQKTEYELQKGSLVATIVPMIRDDCLKINQSPTLIKKKAAEYLNSSFSLKKE